MKSAFAASIMAVSSFLFVGNAIAQSVGSPVDIVTLNSSELSSAKGVPFNETGFPSMEAVEGGDGTVRNVISFDSVDGKVTAGPASFDKMTLKINGFPADEFMYILEGELEITDANGHVSKFGPGDAFVMKKGFSGTWRQLTAIKKYAVTYIP